MFLLALAVAGRTGWALFALSVLLEIPAQLRGRTAPHARLLVGQRAGLATTSSSAAHLAEAGVPHPGIPKACTGQGPGGG